MKMDKPDNRRQYRTIGTTAPNALLRASATAFVRGTAGARTPIGARGGRA